MTEQRLPRHGRNHLQIGSDPLYPIGTDAIRYDFANVGDYLHVETTGPGDGSGIYGLRFDVAGSQGVKFAITGPNGEFNLAAPFIRFDTAGVSLRLLDSGETFFTCDDFASWTFGGWELDTSAGALFVLTATSTSFEIQNHTGGSIFKVDENGDVHIKTGKTVVADL